MFRSSLYFFSSLPHSHSLCFGPQTHFLFSRTFSDVSSRNPSSGFVDQQTDNSTNTPNTKNVNPSATPNPSDFSHRSIPLSPFQKAFLTVGSAFGALADPTRAHLVATLGETTGEEALRQLYQQMNNHPVGRQILFEKPIVTKEKLSFESLATYPPNSLGKLYYEWMIVREFSPDERPKVLFVNDPELAYVMTRYRQSHDFLHTIFQLPSDVFSEVALKWFEMVQTRLPMCFFSSFFGPLTLSLEERFKLTNQAIPWALSHRTSPLLPETLFSAFPFPEFLNSLPLPIQGRRVELFLNIYWEKHLMQDVDELRQLFNFTVPSFSSP